MRFSKILIGVYMGLAACGENPADTVPIAGMAQLDRSFCGDASSVDEPCRLPFLPGVTMVPVGATLRVVPMAGTNIEIGTSPSARATAPAAWSKGTTITFEDTGVVKVFARLADQSGCDPHMIARSYEVVRQYATAAETEGTTAVEMTDPAIVAWASEWTDLTYGDEVSDAYRTPEKALGPASGRALDVLVLGEAGRVTMGFDRPIADGPGPDFAVFENTFNDGFLELAFVEVSSDGEHFYRFSNAYLGSQSIGGFGEHSAGLISGLAGKYKAGFGTPFDLSEFVWSEAAQSGALDLHHVTHIRIIDIPGDGRFEDSFGNKIYDPYPTRQSGGFDLDAVGVINTAEQYPCTAKP